MTLVTSELLQSNAVQNLLCSTENLLCSTENLQYKISSEALVALQLLVRVHNYLPFLSTATLTPSRRPTSTSPS